MIKFYPQRTTKSSIIDAILKLYNWSEFTSINDMKFKKKKIM